MASTQDGQIDASELQKCLTTSGISSSYEPFSKETCALMINMLDRDYSGKMGFSEFKELWGALNQWKVSGYNNISSVFSFRGIPTMPCVAST